MASTASAGVAIVVPAKGTDLLPLSVVTSRTCPAGGTNIFATVFGPGLTADGLNIVPNSTVKLYPHTAGGGLYLSSNNTLRNLVNELPDPPTLKGTYKVRVECRGPAKIADLGDFWGSIVFDGHHGYVAADAGIPTASLVTVPPSEGPSLPTAIGSQAPQVAPTTTASPAARVASTATTHRSASSMGPLLIVVGLVVVVGGVLALVRGRRSASRPGTDA